MIEKKSFGVIVTYRLPCFDLNKEDVYNAFVLAGFDDKFLPYERKPKNAFKKALRESIEGDDGFLVRPVVSKGGTIACGLVQENKDEMERNLDYEVHNVLTLNSESHTIKGKSDFRTNAVVESYKGHLTKLGAVEIGHRVKDILFESMAIDILCEKATFVPNAFQENIDKLIKLFKTMKELGGNVTIEVIGVDSGSETRTTIVRQFMTQTMKALDEELTFCLNQRQQYETGVISYLKPRAFRNQLAKIKTFEERIKTYIRVLELTPDEDKPLWEKLEVLDAEISKNIDLAESKSRKKNKHAILAKLPGV